MTAARLLKDVIDRAGAALLLVALAPFLLFIAVLVRTTSRGPIVYRRRVVGRGGVEFDAYKFRTMVADADTWLAEQPELAARFRANFKLRDDPRLTMVGAALRRVSLDELPQLVNVLRGQMSLVGPRMIAPDEVPKYGALAAKLLSVKPGISGLWQVSGRQKIGYDDRIALDMHYIDHWSLAMDLRILLKTIPAVLTMRGAY